MPKPIKEKEPPMVFVGFRLPPDLLEKAKEVAKSQHRKWSNYLLSLVAEDVERREGVDGKIQAAAQRAKLKSAPRPSRKLQSEQ